MLRRVLLLFVVMLALSHRALAGPVTWKATVAPVDLRAGEGGQIVLRATIQPGWHIYSLSEIKDGPKPTQIELVDGSPLTLAGDPAQPPVATAKDAITGKLCERYEHSVSFGLGFALAEGIIGPVKATLKVTYQAGSATRNDAPTTELVPVELTPVAGPAREDRRDAIGTLPTQDSTRPTDPIDPAQQGSVAEARSKGLFVFMVYCFGGGLLSLLTPCVFPMIPLTVNFFTKRQATSRRAGIRDASAYCIGIIGTFTGVGLFMTAVFGASGLQKLATDPYLNIGFAVLFVALAANLLGFFEIAVPQALQQRAQTGSRKSGIAGPIFMGVASTISSFTCTGAIVGSLLATAATGDRLYPLLGMLSFSTAFALPFFLLALFPQYLSRLPRSGAWMVSVKGYMGFIELAAALKFLSNADLVWATGLISRGLFLVVWAVIAGAAGLYLLGVLPVKGHHRGAIGPLRKFVGVASLAVALWFAVGSRGHSLGSVEAFLPPEPSHWIESFEKAKAEAKRTNRQIFINFTGVTCTNCRFMEKTVFTRQDVKDSLKQYVLVELYTDRTGAHRANDERNQKLEEELTKTVTLPVYVIATPDGKPVSIFPGSAPDPASFVAFLSQSHPRALSQR